MSEPAEPTNAVIPPEHENIDRFFQRARRAVAQASTMRVRGRVLHIVGTVIRAMVPGARIGDLCTLRNPENDFELSAEVVGVQCDVAILTPLGEMQGLSTLTEVIPTGKPLMVPTGWNLLGRVLDGFGRPLDASTKGPLLPEARMPVYRDAPDPLTRPIIDKTLPVGIRAIDGLLTCGEGQRMGIFAAAGGGKSTLMSMLVRGAAVDVIVIAMIGERGREVQELIQHSVGAKARSRVVLVVASSDRPATERAKAAYVATTIAEWYRDQGQRVLLVMDSVTRFARALREIGLAAGEPPTRRGFPPSVFASLPRLMERAGNSHRGSITAFYTVLVEGDDMAEPVADETRSVLDGHIVLSRALAMSNQYPAIDVLASVSRVMSAIVSSEHERLAGRLRELMAKYHEVELLVHVGEYREGAEPLADAAIARIDRIRTFLRQSTKEQIGFDAMLDELAVCLA
ncbi:MAG: EscN/YscN/HrcN family type III secretion system ATPase [Mesorhizobium sp.]|uniref:type III secretion system ATPase SctN n=1 Tax=unclassified Mesorhizobium TaxID=325217 RepID=UPI000FCB91C9|nr:MULTISPECIES: type III secretion system ATPase SctN [unclassified Mesorhizobium]RUV64385.1 EscN/YscN/HrcN family type III secretion system ATPase [Mesorhizobium sp. M5C.F.Ca.IN.020.29.1.1]RWC25238.1 MAG: EscN/YscN/HrcN family type III secretion system ATPase [Mesorhizobium sp.]RWE52602.1 MAG: EscN/YscN/HrcN family type III secretion system ATPase [Mesorhizobium sp.]RWE96115.1 MAG: EscN/YscN/HrcN family type III secretion system ATPase [Mesorhizobium sp.]RWF55875.1 MAG: EscN/YscN/HrcN family